jgi:hypothetical protein
MQTQIRFKFKGRIPDDDPVHQVADVGALADGPVPHCVYVPGVGCVPLYACDNKGISQDDPLRQVTAVRNPGSGPAPHCVYVPGVGCVPQYAHTIVGANDGFDPANDCRGFFTSLKYQVHNNCYNYAVDIATNSMAQPGRRHGISMPGNVNADLVVRGALTDGLIMAGEPGTPLNDVLERASDLDDVHLVALLICPADASVGWEGDYHWVRCHDLETSSWSQKDGPDQITDFDFAGMPIADPSQATWTANQGPAPKSGSPDFFTTYSFRAWMLVPHRGVEIL